MIESFFSIAAVDEAVAAVHKAGYEAFDVDPLLPKTEEDFDRMISWANLAPALLEGDEEVKATLCVLIC